MRPKLVTWTKASPFSVYARLSKFSSIVNRWLSTSKVFQRTWDVMSYVLFDLCFCGEDPFQYGELTGVLAGDGCDTYDRGGVSGSSLMPARWPGLVRPSNPSISIANDAMRRLWAPCPQPYLNEGRDGWAVISGLRPWASQASRLSSLYPLLLASSLWAQIRPPQQSSVFVSVLFFLPLFRFSSSSRCLCGAEASW